MRFRSLALVLEDFIIQEKGERKGCFSRNRVKEIKGGIFQILGFCRKISLGRPEKGLCAGAFRFRAQKLRRYGQNGRKGKGQCGLTHPQGKPAAAKNEYGSAYKEENFLQKRPLPSAIVRAESILAEIKKSVNCEYHFFLFSPEVRIPLFEKGFNRLPVIFTSHAGLLALRFKI